MRHLWAAVRREDPRERVLAQATLVNTIGLGLFFAAGTIYLVRSAGLRPAQVGLGLTLGSLVGLVAGVPLGDQADRRGARRVVIGSWIVEAAACVALLAVHDVWSLAVVAAVAAVGRGGSGSGWGALVGLVSQEGEAARLRSYLRAIANVGVAIGTVGAAVVLAIDTRAGYAAMLLIDAATFLLAAVIIMRLPPIAATRTAPGDAEAAAPADDAAAAPRWLALRDLRYLALTLACGVAGLQYFVLTEALPLWVTLHTDAPRWVAAMLFLVAAVIVAALQVPATRSIDGVRSAARLLALSGPVFVVAWAMMAEASELSAVAATVVLVVAIVVHSLAEVWQAAGTFELSFALARPEAHGQYQGVFGMGTGVSEAFAPAIVIALCVTWGQPGWYVLGVIVTLGGVACALIERLSDAPQEAEVEAEMATG